MGFFDFLKRGSAGKEKNEPAKREVTARSSYWGNAYAISFDGEKNAGEAGPIIDYYLNHQGLRARSWQSYLENEISKTVLDRYTIWIIDKGLKLQCEPSKVVLEAELKQKFDAESFNKITESRFAVWSKSKRASFNQMQTLSQVAKEAFKNAKVGGDVLVILRYKENQLTVELIDGARVCANLTSLKAEGNRIVDGVEIDENGTHVAYHVKGVKGFEGKRVPARSAVTGLVTAFLVYGSRFRLNEVRGLPTIATSLETLKKIDRYKEAAVGSAEERQKIAFAIEHNQFSDGENPMADALARAFDTANAETAAIPIDAQGQALAEVVAATTNKQVFNMPIGSKLTALESKNEMFFKDFFGTNADIICGAVGIPPNVAFSIYNDSFSASRAATKDWEHTIDVERDDFQTQFYNPIFAFWLHIQILDFKIPAPGYLQAFTSKNWSVIEAYLCTRFTGPMFPHIDPLKEAKAEREKLGPLGKNIPLTTTERATEILNGGDSNSNMEQFAEEIKKAEELGLMEEEREVIEPTEADSED